MTSFLFLNSAYITNILTNRKADRLTVAVKYHIQVTVMRILSRSTIVNGRQHKHIYEKKTRSIESEMAGNQKFKRDACS